MDSRTPPRASEPRFDSDTWTSCAAITPPPPGARQRRLLVELSFHCLACKAAVLGGPGAGVSCLPFSNPPRQGATQEASPGGQITLSRCDPLWLVAASGSRPLPCPGTGSGELDALPTSASAPSLARLDAPRLLGYHLAGPFINAGRLSDVSQTT